MSRQFYCTAFVALLVACSEQPDNLQTIADFERLKNSGDLAATLALFADDARLDFGPMGSIEGRAAIANILGYDVALEAQLRHEDCEALASDVTCRVVETNDWLGTVGIESITYDESRYSFNNDGRIQSVTTTLSVRSAQALGAALNDFHSWAIDNETERYANLFSLDGRFIYSYENGEEVLELLKNWQSATKDTHQTSRDR